MKKLLLTLACAACFGFAQADQVTEVLTINSFDVTKKTTYTDVTYTSDITGITYTGNLCRSNNDCIQLRAKSNSGLVVTDNPNGYKIVSVSAENDTDQSTSNQWDVYGKATAYASSANLYSDAEKGTLIGSGATTSTVTFTDALDFFGFRANKNAVYLTKITIVYEGSGSTTPDTRLEAGLSFPEEKYEAVLGQDFTAPVLTKATNAEITYASDKETVATVDATTGAVTLVGAGTARITASAAANDEYKAGSASYLLTVTEPLPENLLYNWPMGVEFTFENPEYLAVWSHDNTYGLKGSAYKGGINVAVAYAVSPEIDLSGVNDGVLDFDQAVNNFKVNNANIEAALVAQYVEVVVREVGTTEWTMLAQPAMPESQSWTFYANGPVSLAAYAGKQIQIAFKYTSTEDCAGTWEVKNIAVTGTRSSDVPTLKDAGMSFPEAHYYVTEGETFTAPVLTKATTAEVTYTSDKEEVATVDAATGAVTIVGVGTAKIIATAAANDEYKAGEASYLLTVNEAVEVPADAIYFGLVENSDDWAFDNTDLPEGLTYVWQWKTYNGVGYLNASAYKNGAVAAEAWAISPEIDLTNYVDATVKFDHAAKFQTTLQQLCGLYARVNGGNWEQLNIPTWPTAGSWDFVNSGDMTLDSFVGGKIQLGFKYGSTAEGADTWEIKNFAVTGTKKLQGIDAVEAEDAAPAVYYNLQGVQVANPANGHYIKVQGKKATKLYIK